MIAFTRKACSHYQSKSLLTACLSLLYTKSCSLAMSAHPQTPMATVTQTITILVNFQSSHSAIQLNTSTLSLNLVMLWSLFYLPSKSSFQASMGQMASLQLGVLKLALTDVAGCLVLQPSWWAQQASLCSFVVRSCSSNYYSINSARPAPIRLLIILLKSTRPASLILFSNLANKFVSTITRQGSTLTQARKVWDPSLFERFAIVS